MLKQIVFFLWLALCAVWTLGALFFLWLAVDTFLFEVNICRPDVLKTREQAAECTDTDAVFYYSSLFAGLCLLLLGTTVAARSLPKIGAWLRK